MKKIIVVEDDLLVIERIECELERGNYNVIGRAVNGFDAVESVVSLKPDVVLMDIRMPDMDGLEATRRIMEKYPVPIIIMTAYYTEELIKEASIAGVGAYLMKPPNIQHIDRAVFIAAARFEDMMELRRVNAELKDALDKVKLLTGFLPICSSCKKIKDKDGDWTPLETYIHSNSEAEFTHSLCPECLKKLYPDYYK